MKNIPVFCVGLAVISRCLELFCCANSLEDVKGQDVQRHQQQQDEYGGHYQELDPMERSEVEARKLPGWNVLKTLSCTSNCDTWEGDNNPTLPPGTCPELSDGCKLVREQLSDSKPGAYLICEYNHCPYSNKDAKTKMQFPTSKQKPRPEIPEDWTWELSFHFDFPVRDMTLAAGTTFILSSRGWISFEKPPEGLRDHAAYFEKRRESHTTNRINFWFGSGHFTSELQYDSFLNQFGVNCYFMQFKGYEGPSPQSQPVVLRAEFCADGLVYTRVKESPRNNLIVGSVGPEEHLKGEIVRNGKVKNVTVVMVPVPKHIYAQSNF